MIPDKPLPFNGNFSSPEEYIENLLQFAQTSHLFQILCGGVHITDFFTSDPGLFESILPTEWHPWLLSCDIMKFIDLLVRDDLDSLQVEEGEQQPPEDLLMYIRTIRSLTLNREYDANKREPPVLPHSAAVGMKPKKIHEVRNFADYVEQLSIDINDETGEKVSHFVDFGSGQNYLGRALASEPFNRYVVAVEGRDNNVSAAKGLDIKSKLAIKPVVRRNKKLWQKVLAITGPNPHDDPEALARAVKEICGEEAYDFRPVRELGAKCVAEEGKGYVQYVSGRLDSGDLSEVITKIDRIDLSEGHVQDPKLMAISIHSCGNLSHYGIRSLVMNKDIRAIAIVGCCYNLMTERLGPPKQNQAHLRPTLQPVNARVQRESEKYDPQGFPMSKHFGTYQGDGVRLNITARVMACQAPQNWTREDSEGFFTRHFYRAVLQKIFLDRGVVRRVWHFGEPGSAESTEKAASAGSPFDMSTNPIVIGSLRKSCYVSFKTYVRGVMEKLTTSSDYKQYSDVIKDKMGDITDEEIEQYEVTYTPQKQKVCIIWSLMAFSATAVESLIVADRWTFLREHQDIVQHAWVETVFDYKESPRNLVVVGVKKKGAE